MKKIIFKTTLLCFLSLNVFAGGNGSGSGGQGYGPINAFTEGSGRRFAVQPKINSQVLYMNDDGSLVKYATNIKGTPKVDVKIIKLDETSNPFLVESLRQSQESQVWVDVKEVPEPSEENEQRQKQIEALGSALRW